ncbi:hypothetical protein [Pseudodesulfovibrio tunisiensis]|uniref:hypothetical protein n=1 Tax=Pseudodesulfovibrio tunisiensis TaxID=463192 RepID=UPI001FB4F57D|nr:hypothetical protein [Pseudodesulfovibrio tunisiensis]
MSNLSPLQFLSANRNKFKEMENQFTIAPSSEGAAELISFAMTDTAGVYFSSEVENFFMDLARKTKSLPPDYKTRTGRNKSFLHVMTETLLHGGHTRIVERWINSASPDQTHSVVLTKQNDVDQIPDLLKKFTIEKNGNLHLLQQGSIESKANELRDVALSYETVILHHHPYDPIPLMAFSVPEFTRTVICFNHAGHRFWIGKNIVDWILDIEKGQQEISYKKRGIKNSTLINMPVAEIASPPQDIKRLRRSLGFDAHDKIMVSMASNYKFDPIKDLSFTDTLQQILSADSQVKFIGIGINPQNQYWAAILRKFPDRIRLMGVLCHKDTHTHLKISDLYIDSFPMNSWLSTTDAISIGRLPCLVLKTPLGYLPYLEGSSAICEDTSSLVEKSLFLLASPQEREKLKDELLFRVKRYCSPNHFQEKIASCVASAHKKTRNDPSFIDFSSFFPPNDIYMAQINMTIRTHKKGIPFLWEKIVHKNAVKKTTLFKLFSFCILAIAKENKKKSLLFFPKPKILADFSSQ